MTDSEFLKVAYEIGLEQAYNEWAEKNAGIPSFLTKLLGKGAKKARRGSFAEFQQRASTKKKLVPKYTDVTRLKHVQA